MEKCLIDILDREMVLVRDINNLKAHAEDHSKYRVGLLITNNDLALIGPYLKHLKSEIDRINAERFELQEKLAEIRRELANYIKYTILRGE